MKVTQKGGQQKNPVYDDMVRLGGITSQGKGSTNFGQYLKVLEQYRHLQDVCFRWDFDKLHFAHNATARVQI